MTPITDLTSPVRKVVFVSDLAAGVEPDTGTPKAGLGTGADDMFTLASTTSGAGGGVKHHNGRKGIDTVSFTLASGTLDFTEDTDGAGTSDTLGNAYNRFSSIEILDLTDTGAQSVILSRSAVHHMTELRNGFGGTNAQTTIIVRTGSEDYLEFADKAGWAPGADLMLDTDGDGLDERYTPYVLGNARVLVSAGEQAPIVPRTGFALGGEAGDDRFGGSVSGAGDINGDGIADFVIGADRHDTGSSNNGAVYVVYGRLGGLAGPIAISDLTAEQGFVIYNTDTSDNSYLGFSVSAAGDVNGDGIADLTVGANRRNVDSVNEGGAYVIYGKRGDGTQFGAAEMDGSNPTGRRIIDINVALGAAGGADFAIKGNASNARLGNSVSAAGDVNGDGIDDLFVGAYNSSDGTNQVGTAHVVYGQSGGHSGTIDTASLGSSGFTIFGESDEDYLGNSVSVAGDVNGDGLDDLIVGADDNDDGGTNAGEVYVIYGSANPSDITGTVLDALGTRGFTIQGGAAGDRLGGSVSGGGDVNGDGLADLIIGASQNDDGGNNAGAAYVIYGKSGGHSGVIDVADLTPAQGFVIQGDGDYDRLGSSVSVAGDIDGDGLDDLIVGAVRGSNGSFFAGEAYVIYGQAGTDGTQFGKAVSGRRLIDTTSLTTEQGFLIQGDSIRLYLGVSVSGAGDIDGDGIDDLIIGARDGEIAGGTTDTGSVYVLYGRADRAFGVNAKANSFGANIKESDTAYAGLSSPVRKVVFLSDIAKSKPADAAAPKAALGTGADDIFTLASTTGGANDGVKHHNGRAGIDTVKFTEADGADAAFVGTLDFTEDADGSGGGDSTGNAYNRFDSVEILDLTATSAQTVILSEQSVYRMTDLRNGFGGTNAQTTIIVRAGSEDTLGITGAFDKQSGTVSLDTDGDGTAETYASYILGNARVLVSAGARAPIVPHPGFALGGEAFFDSFGLSVSGAGDINGDGLDDFIIGARSHDTGATDNGAAYVVYGRLGFASPISVSSLTAEQGFVIYNTDTGDSSRLGRSVSAAGDINGDGIADLIVGAPYRDVDGTNDGEAYVIYGKQGDGTQFGTAEMDNSATPLAGA